MGTMSMMRWTVKKMKTQHRRSNEVWSITIGLQKNGSYHFREGCSVTFVGLLKIR